MPSVRDISAIHQQPNHQFTEPLLLADARDQLRRTHALLLGVGAVARQQARVVRHLGVRRFTLVDPKTYSHDSVGLQCSSEEVHQPKVDVVAHELSRAGAQVRGFAADLFDVPDGVVDDRTIIFLSVDNRRAEVGANHLATRMGAPIVKTNIEPAYEIAAVRAFHPQSSAEVCLECNFTDRQYERQQHPRSCDGGTGPRRTASPPRLARAAAALGAMAFVGILDPDRRSTWLGYEVQLCTRSFVTRRSRLEPNARCRWQHDSRWPNLQRLPESPAQLSLAELLRGASMATGDNIQRLRFCHPVALAARCAVWRFAARGAVGPPRGGVRRRLSTVPRTYLADSLCHASHVVQRAVTDGLGSPVGILGRAALGRYCTAWPSSASDICRGCAE